jgi:hypothetical protein
LRNQLARRLAATSDAMLLASATPHNGDKEPFAELIRLLDPAAIADPKDYTAADITHLYLRRTKISPEVRDQIGDQWADRGPSTPLHCAASQPEEKVFAELTDTWLAGQWRGAPATGQDRLFPYTLAKSFLSSHHALAATVAARSRKASGTELAALNRLAALTADITDEDSSKLHRLIDELTRIGVGPGSATRAVVFRATGNPGLAAQDRADAAGARPIRGRHHRRGRARPADPGWPGLPPLAPLAGEPGYDDQTADAGPGPRAERVRAFVDAAGGLETAGYCRTRAWTMGYANTAGQAVSMRTSEAAIDGIARHGGSDGLARATSVRLSDLDGARLGTRAAAKARAGADPVELPPGRYEVVLEPPAVADVLQHLLFWVSTARRWQKGAASRNPAQPSSTRRSHWSTTRSQTAYRAGRSTERGRRSGGWCWSTPASPPR